MCQSCWQEAVAPQIDNGNVRRAAFLCDEIYKEHPAGGAMHIHLDDWNLGNDFFKDETPRFIGWHNDFKNLFIVAYAAFRKLSEKERYSAVALSKGYWSV